MQRSARRLRRRVPPWRGASFARRAERPAPGWSVTGLRPVLPHPQRRVSSTSATASRRGQHVRACIGARPQQGVVRGQ
jgi:hypothetical protein